MFLNAESASLALEKHDTMYYIKGLKLTERKHFIQAFYRAMIMSLLSRAELPESLLASCDMLDFQRVKEVLQFTTSVKAYLGGVPVGTNGPAKDILEVMNLSIAVRRMKLLIQNFLAVASNRYLRKPLWAPTYYFIAYEKLAETTESLRGAQLAGTLPLLPEGAPWRIISDDSIEQR